MAQAELKNLSNLDIVQSMSQYADYSLENVSDKDVCMTSPKHERQISNPRIELLDSIDYSNSHSFHKKRSNSFVSSTI